MNMRHTKITGLAIAAILGAQPLSAGMTLQGNTLIDRADETTEESISGAISALHSARPETTLTGVVKVPQARDGHFYANILVNGVNIRFLIDTGATVVVLKIEDATRAHIPTSFLNFVGVANTANGEVKIASTTFDTMTFDSVTDTNVQAYVSNGEMEHSLLGMSYLSSFQHVEIIDNVLVMRR